MERSVGVAAIGGAGGNRITSITDSTDGAVNHAYSYVNGKLVQDFASGRTYQLLNFFYDDADRPYAMKYQGAMYYYITNLQGDVLGLVDGNGSSVASYTYDPYGKVLSATGTLAEINPLRYRGYYYDVETGFYLAGTRYYDPATGRWISPEPNAFKGIFDDAAGLIGYNIYAYCANNPINYSDPTGEFIITAIIVGAIAGAAIGGTVGGVVSYNAAKDSGMSGADLFWSTIGGIGKGMAIGGIGGGLIAATGGVVASYGITSVAGTAMVSGTLTIAAKTTEVTALQIKKSLREGLTGWQTANNAISAVFDNGVKVAGMSSLTKVGTTSASYMYADLSKHKVIPLSGKTFLQAHTNPVTSYIFVAYAWYETVSSIISSDPVMRANERGYLLR